MWDVLVQWALVLLTETLAYLAKLDWGRIWQATIPALIAGIILKLLGAS
jgi:hypothetical protein